MGEKVVTGRRTRYKPVGCFRAAMINAVGDVPSDGSCEDGENRKNDFDLAVGGLVSPGPDGWSKIGTETFHSDPAPDNGQDGEDDERDGHHGRAFVRMDIGIARFTKEGEIPKPEHVERGERSGDDSDEPENLPEAATGCKCRGEDGIL